VLSLPPAFVLSQDQTLKLNEISSRLVTVKTAPQGQTPKSATSPKTHPDQPGHLTTPANPADGFKIKRDRRSISARHLSAPNPQEQSRPRFSFFLTNNVKQHGIPRPQEPKPQNDRQEPQPSPNRQHPAPRRLSRHQPTLPKDKTSPRPLLKPGSAAVDERCIGQTLPARQSEKSPNSRPVEKVAIHPDRARSHSSHLPSACALGLPWRVGRKLL
jgi:hypothetical protein